MISVSEQVKALLKSDSSHKEMRITIAGVSTPLGNSSIHSESFKLTESIVDGSNWEFVGCIASQMTVKVQSNQDFTKKDWKGHSIKAELAVYLPNGSLSPYIPLFFGYIDSCKKDADKGYQELTCYDALYSKFNVAAFPDGKSVYNWYKSFLKKQKSLYQIREAIFEKLGIEEVLPAIGYLPNDNLKVKKRFNDKNLTILDMVKGLCQINGCCGRMDREGRFVWQYISSGSLGSEFGAFPNAFYPGIVVPGQDVTKTVSGGVEYLDYYRSVHHQDKLINPFTNGITIRNNSDDAGIIVNTTKYATTDMREDEPDEPLVDDDTEIVAGTYILEGNMWAYKVAKKYKQAIASNILVSVGKDTMFRQFDGQANGLPYLECGDKIVYNKADGTDIEFIVTTRTLEGIQSLKDTYTADVDDDNDTFITTSQNCVTNKSNSLSSEEVTEIATDVSTTTTNETLQNGNYMYVVSWDASTGILQTSSGAPNA